MKREFLMLAQTYDPIKHPIGYWFASEKLDGVRAYWDGGVTRGVPCSAVQFANTEKDSRYLIPPKATGLWSRYGKSIQAPGWFLDQLPKDIPLDGELWMGRGKFQSLISTVKDLVPGDGWVSVEYRVFDSPPYRVMFSNGKINNTNFKIEFSGLAIANKYHPIGGVRFNEVQKWLAVNMQGNAVVKVHPQEQLQDNDSAIGRLKELCEKVAQSGGEGIMLRHPTSYWVPGRSYTLLKHKPSLDMEGIVVGLTSGRETDKGSKLLGKMGALILDIGGKRLELSGFTEDERELDSGEARLYAAMHPGEEMPLWVKSKHFPIGATITFKYREMTDDGIPKEARYWRKA